ncbi:MULTISPECIES: Fur family transcriptional regulator [unclassified Zobellia]|uniref:Fur family transcriptional regulator n=1 Tax=unclassified Zobellia TaxID=2620635 RepID=UPI001C06DE84|nr:MULTISPECIES: transcriptional repressor [unclassified Zobellia]MBU2973053.1 transcriptional repressor [Zobellia sp. B3R18]MDO6820262.1 transcriptional repressor [Zobellia sp. 1_MG-2023]
MKRRNTPTKEAVLSVLSSTTKAMSQNAIEQKIDMDIDRATIYRVLNRFCDDGVLHKVVADDGKQYFALCIKCDEKEKPLHHFHFRCTQCETIECLPVPVNFSLDHGYDVQSVNCVLTGVCNDCS